MTEDCYPVRFDENSGRAYVEATGDVYASNIQKTFLAIILNKVWLDGDRSILWDFKNAFFDEAFEFADIFKTAQVSKSFTKPGKSAIIVEKNEMMMNRVANFYRSLAENLTSRKIEIFYDRDGALAWLDS